MILALSPLLQLNGNNMFFRNIYIIFFIVFNHISVLSQKTDTLIIDSTINHVVKKGETSYGISKKYNVDINLFYQYNPDAIEGLKKDMVLVIPKYTIPTKSQIEPDSTSHLTHSVINGETLWSLAKKYGVSINDLKSINNLEDEGIQLGQLIKIPNELVDTNNIVKSLVKHPNHPLLKSCDTIVFHKVKRKETLYSLSKLYNITINQIIKNNPELESAGLQKGSRLKIIYKIKNCEEDETINDSTLTSIIKLNDTINDSAKLIKVSLFLPFLIDDYQKLILDCKLNENCPLEKSSVNSIQLYNGIVLALENLRDSGYNISLSVYDTKKDTSIISEILNSAELLNSDLIIGPIFSKQIKLIRSFAKENNIPMICPTSIPNQALFQYPILYKINPSKSSQITAISSYLKSNPNYKNRITLLANRKDLKSVTYANLFANTYNDSLSGNDSIKPLLLHHNSSFSNVSISDTNVFVVAASDVPFITSVFTKIIRTKNTRNFYDSYFMVFGFDDILKMNTIDEKYKNLFNLHVSSKGNVDYDSEFVIYFIDLYKRKFEIEPDLNTFIGFDLTSAIFNNLFGEKTEIYNGIYYDFNFKQIDNESGFENKAVKILQYQDHKLKSVF